MPVDLATLRRRAAPLVLLAGGALAAYMLTPRVPRARTVEVRIEGHASVTAVDMAWTPQTTAGKPEADAVQGTSWHFDRGKAPPTLDTPVRLPDGRYVVDVSVARGSETETFRRTVTLDDTDHVLIRLR